MVAQLSTSSRQRQFAGSARRGSAVVEYALLLAVIGCSVLFGARLIATSGISQFNRLSGGPMVGGASVDNSAADSDLVAAAQQLPTASAPAERSAAWQFGSLVLILGCGVGATVGLMMIRKKKEVAEESPEMVESSTSGRRTERFARKRQDIYRVLCQNLKMYSRPTCASSISCRRCRSPFCLRRRSRTLRR